MDTTKLGIALLSGLAGAAVLTTIHQAARRYVPHAPRADVLGRRAAAATSVALRREPPVGQSLERTALAGDLVANGLTYSLIGMGDRETVMRRGAAIGLLSGIAAVALPGLMGLGTKPTARSASTAAMTIAWYTLGGLAAAAAFRVLAGGTPESSDPYPSPS
jgi:hypothetical protein